MWGISLVVPAVPVSLTMTAMHVDMHVVEMVEMVHCLYKERCIAALIR